MGQRAIITVQGGVSTVITTFSVQQNDVGDGQ
jgi:hypothetical protein